MNCRLTLLWEDLLLRQRQRRFQRLVDLLHHRVRQMPDDLQDAPLSHRGQPDKGTSYFSYSKSTISPPSVPPTSSEVGRLSGCPGRSATPALVDGQSTTR